MPVFKKTAVFPVLLAGLCLWGALIYSNTLRAPFVFDDYEFIVRNPSIRGADGVGHLWEQPLYRKRFVAFASFAMNYRLHGYDVTGYHLVNLAAHGLTALSVVWFLLLLFRTPRLQRDPIFENRHAIALLGGWLFVSHPVQTETVTYISQRFTGLAALLYLLSACCYLKGRLSAHHPPGSRGWFLLSAASAALGMLTKEEAFTLPAALVLIESLFFRPPAGEKTSGLKRGLPPRIYLGGMFLLGFLLMAVLSFNIPAMLLEDRHLGITSGKYLLTQFRVVMVYLGLLFFPAGQNLDYDFPLSTTLWDAPTLFSLAGLLALLAAGLALARRHPLAGFGILWFFLTLSVTSSFVPIRDVIFEHRLYLPSVGFVTALCASVLSLPGNRRAGVMALIAVIAVFSTLTYRRNAVWADDVMLWEDTVQKSPAKSRPHANLGMAYANRGQYDKAVAEYHRALELDSGRDKRVTAQIHVNLAGVYGALGRYQDMISICRKSVEFLPKNAQAYSHLAYAHLMTGDHPNALRAGEEAVKIAPKFDEALNTLGAAHAAEGRYDMAMEFFERALRANPSYAPALENLNKARALTGN